MKTYQYLLFFTFSFAACNSNENKYLAVSEMRESCGFLSQTESKAYNLSDPTSDAKSSLESIMHQIGLPANFELKAAEVDYALAVVVDKNRVLKRYILYNQSFFDDIDNKSGSRFASLSILAHEIGHHLAGHSLSEKGSRPLLELEADHFSGFILKKMGCTLKNVQFAVNKLCPEERTSTHPGKNARLTAIESGWNDATFINKPGEYVTTEGKVNTGFEPNFKVSYAPKWVLAMRNKILSTDELALVNSKDLNTKQSIDAATLVTVLNKGQDIEVLDSLASFYKIKAMSSGQIFEGYIPKRLYGKSTIDAHRK